MKWKARRIRSRSKKQDPSVWMRSEGRDKGQRSIL